MQDSRATGRRYRRMRKPLDPARLEEMALAYVARFATSAGKLEAYLTRKLRERGWDEETADAPDLAGLVERFVARGWIDDAGWARMRSQSLLARGYGARRVADALRAGGITEDLREANLPDEATRREAAQAHARRRRLGPFGPARGDDPQAGAKLREKQLAAMLRAGHDFAAATFVVDAACIEEVAQWVEEAAEKACE